MKTTDMALIEPIACEDGCISYGVGGINVEAAFGISSRAFLAMHADLKGAGLRIQKKNAHDAPSHVSFVLHCHAISCAGAEIATLVREFNAAQNGDGSDLLHATSLAKLYYHYNAAGHSVQILRTHGRTSTGDLLIDGVECELKVRIDQTSVRARAHDRLLREGGMQAYHDAVTRETRSMDQDLWSAIRNRAEAGHHQGDCLFLDLSNHFHTWNYHRLHSLEAKGQIRGLSQRPVIPVVGANVLFSPDNAINLNHRQFLPRAYFGYLPSP